jgi:predicted esterase
VVENGMPRFFRRSAEGVFDQDDLKKQTHDLARFVTEAAKTCHFNLTKVVAVGFSNGANIATSTLLLHPHLLTGAVLLRPMGIPLKMEVPDLSGTRILIESGTNDPLIEREEPKRLAMFLEKGNAEVSLQWHPAGHNLEDEEIAVVKQWLTRFS